MDKLYAKSWNSDPNTGRFTPSALEWLCWLGQPLLYDGGLCVNRTLEEHCESVRRKGQLAV